MTSRVDDVLFALRMGDNALVLGHRLSEWCGHAPVLEEDLAIANTALDLLGQARQWLTLAGEWEGLGRDEDALAYQRDGHEFRNVLLVEQDNGSYADTLARQFYFDLWHRLLLNGLTHSANPQVAAVAGPALRAAEFHTRRSADLVIRLGDGSEESHRRMQAGLEEYWIFTGELFEVDAADRSLIDAGVVPDPGALLQPWRDEVVRVIEQATLRVPAATGMRTGGRRGVHSERLGYLLAELQFLPRAYPGASW